MSLYFTASKLPSPLSKTETKDQELSAEDAFNLEDKLYAYDVHEFELKLRRARHYGSSECAKDTCHLLRLIIHKGRFETWGQLLRSIQIVGERLVRARPLELVIGNIVKRLLFIIRREHRYWTKLQRKMQEIERKKKTSSNKKYQKLNTKKIQLTQMDIRQEDETLNPSILDIFHAREERNYDRDTFIAKNKSTIINEVNEV